MGRPITISINVSKIDKQYIYEGKSGKYLNIAVFENRDGPDKYGNTHYCVQDLPKEARDQGVKGAIIGNAKFPDASDAPARRGNGDRFSRPPERQPQRDYKLDDRGQSPTAGSTYRGKNAYVPPVDDSDDLSF